jgi:serine/threonine protein phosphatase PrpC
MVQDAGQWKNALEYVTVTDVGRRRSNNQDSFAVVLAGDLDDWQNVGHMFLVADGMGAHAAGELASQLVAENMPHLYKKHCEASAPEALYRAVIETNEEVHRRGQANIEFNNMGTTVSSLLLLPQGALIAHVGDSRVYRIRGKQLEQMTFDHSLVWEMRASGQLDDDHLLSDAIPKNVITRSIGPYSHVQPDFEGPFAIETGDLFLICSDGLSGLVSDTEMAVILATLPLRAAGSLLKNLANIRGGSDNITLVLAKAIGDPVVTNREEFEPIKIGAHVTQPPIPAPLWVALGVTALFAAAAFVVGREGTAIALAVIAIIGAAGFLLWRFRNKHRAVTIPQGQRMGKAPYATASAEDVVSEVKAMIADVYRIAQGGATKGWHDPAGDGRNYIMLATQHAKDGEGGEALEQLRRAVEFLDTEWQQSQADDSSNSSIDY